MKTISLITRVKDRRVENGRDTCIIDGKRYIRGYDTAKQETRWIPLIDSPVIAQRSSLVRLNEKEVLG